MPASPHRAGHTPCSLLPPPPMLLLLLLLLLPRLPLLLLLLLLLPSLPLLPFQFGSTSHSSPLIHCTRC